MGFCYSCFGKVCELRIFKYIGFFVTVKIPALTLPGMSSTKVRSSRHTHTNGSVSEVFVGVDFSVVRPCLAK